MQDLNQAARFLLSVDKEQATEVLRYLDAEYLQKLRAAIENVHDADTTEVKSLLRRFLNNEAEDAIQPNDVKIYVETHRSGKDSSSSDLNNVVNHRRNFGLEILKNYDIKQIAKLVLNEHPQIVAIVLTYLESDKAAKLLLLLTKQQRIDVLVRMATLSEIRPAALHELANIIEEMFSEQKNQDVRRISGINNVANLINHLGSSIESQVLAGIDHVNNQLGQQIRDKLLVFEELRFLNNHAIKALLNRLNPEILINALAGASDGLKERVFDNMLPRSVDVMKAKLRKLTSISRTEVEDAKQQILMLARHLAQSGEIQLNINSESTH